MHYRIFAGMNFYKLSTLAFLILTNRPVIQINAIHSRFVSFVFMVRRNAVKNARIQPHEKLPANMVFTSSILKYLIIVVVTSKRDSY